MLGDITQTRRGVPVNGEPAFSLGVEASPNHHELALRFAFSDNFFLEPSVSSDGVAGGRSMRPIGRDALAGLMRRPAPGFRRPGGDQRLSRRIGFTDANASPEPNDLVDLRQRTAPEPPRQSVINGNGFEFAVIDEPAARATGARGRTF
jgi:hypothetical protein